MSISQNLLTRLRLLKVALTQRFVFPEIIAMAKSYGYGIDDVHGELGPFSLVERALRRPSSDLPDFAMAIAATIVVEEGYTVGWSAEPSVSLCLGQLVAASRAATVIELGCFIGWTTAHLALALQSIGDGGIVHYVDYEERYLDRTSANLVKLNLSAHSRRYRGLSHDPELLKQLPSQADLIFIDTSHSYEDTLLELELYTPRLAPNGCIALHDSIKAPGVRRALLETRRSYVGHTFATERGNGLTLLFPL